VYVVFAHRNPGQVARLVSRLTQADARVLVHVDRASSIYEPLRRSLPNHVEFLRRRRARWGSYGPIAVALDALRTAIHTPSGHVVLLSGQDYPVKPVEEIHDRLRELGDRSVMQHERFPVESWASICGGGYDRLQHYFWISTRWERSLPRLRRTIPGGRWPYGGSMWWALSRSAAELVVRETTDDSKLERYFRTTKLPDEMFFQTILMNSPLADSVINRSSTFALWQRDTYHPAILEKKHIPMLRELPHLFARKFDEEANPGVLDALDATLA
jgi:hypothetical protein